MIGGPPLFRTELFRAIHSSAYDLPEDFLSRLEPGLDEETKASLANGIRTLRLLRKMRDWTVYAFVLGIFLYLGGAFIMGFVSVAILGELLAAVGMACLLFALVTFLVTIVISLINRGDLRRVVAFARAMQGSFLARDIA